jgi:hypothetical protein
MYSEVLTSTLNKPQLVVHRRTERVFAVQKYTFLLPILTVSLHAVLVEFVLHSLCFFSYVFCCFPLYYPQCLSVIGLSDVIRICHRKVKVWNCGPSHGSGSLSLTCHSGGTGSLPDQSV